jgi:hydroxyacylglutathione hydrolase
LRAEGKFTLPTTIGAEKAANPFLRADMPEVAAALGMSGKPPAQVFAEIRGRKDRF